MRTEAVDKGCLAGRLPFYLADGVFQMSAYMGDKKPVKGSCRWEGFWRYRGGCSSRWAAACTLHTRPSPVSPRETDMGRDPRPPEGKRDFCHWLQCSQDPPALFLLPYKWWAKHSNPRWKWRVTDGSENGSVFVLPASLFFLFQICQKSGNAFDSWLYSRADVSLELRARIREKNLLCTPIPSCARWINAFNRGLAKHCKTSSWGLLKGETVCHS